MVTKCSLLGSPLALPLSRMGSTSQLGRSYLQGDIQTLVVITLEREKGEPGMTTLTIVVDLLIAHCAPPRRAKFPDGKSIPKSLTTQPGTQQPSPYSSKRHHSGQTSCQSVCTLLLIFCTTFFWNLEVWVFFVFFFIFLKTTVSRGYNCEQVSPSVTVRCCGCATSFQSPALIQGSGLS